MAQPTTYNRNYNFTDYQAENPSDPLPADRIDAEFNLVKQTLDETLANLALLQRDDTELANATVGRDQLKTELLLGVSEPTPWLTATAYAVGDTVFNGSGFYLCETAHTSGTFATDLSAGKWTLLADFSSLVGDDLVAIEALASTGFAVRTASNTWAQRSIAASGAGLSVANGSGVSGNPTISLADDVAAIEALIPSNDDVLQRKAGAWTNRTIAQLLTDLGLGALYQPLDADLTTWAGLTPSANAQSLVTAADYSAMRTLLGLVIGTNVQAFDADLSTWAGLTPSANAQSLVTASNYAAMRGLLDLEVGTDFLSVAAAQAALSGASLTSVTVATDDKVLIQDTSDSNNLKTVTAQSIANLASVSFTDPVITGTILEDVYTISDGAAFEIDPGNGSIQIVVLGANRTPLATNFAAGESVTMMIDDGTARTITWTSVLAAGNWVGGTAPTLATSGYTVVELWKVASTIYGSYVGNVT